MTYFPLHQTTCFFIPLVAPCKPLLMLNDKNKMTLTLALNSLNGQYGTEYNILMAGSLLSMIPIVVIYALAQKYFKEGLMAGGVKG